ncbi:MAG: TonB-dependent receptor [Prevotellaceae bacterium]|nr:TonB-dependent receptor [Prevotellaceae bacterium]
MKKYCGLCCRLLIVTIFSLCSFFAEATDISGVALDSRTLLPIEGVGIEVKNGKHRALTAADGSFRIEGMKGEKWTLSFKRLSYHGVEMEWEADQPAGSDTILLDPETEFISEVLVSARMRNNTENSMTAMQKSLPQVTSGVSAGQIARGSDRTASEVVRRVSGVTVIDDKFIVVRGLSPRYSSVRINGMAVSGAENESRAFPFDIIPSSRMENLMIYKSPAPDLPGDFAGGFVNITSKEAPEKNSMEFGYSTGFYVKTIARGMRLPPRGSADLLGFDAGWRAMKGVPAHLSFAGTGDELTRLTRAGFNNEWQIRQRNPLPDQRFSFVLTRRIRLKSGATLGNITALSYDNTFKSIRNMHNARFGIYSADDDRPLYLDDYLDQQYTNDVRVGLMHNWSLRLNSATRIEFKSLFNMAGRNRLTEREGVKDQSSMYLVRQTEMLYSSRPTFGAQLAGSHTLDRSSTLKWSAGYSYAGKNEPDRRIVTAMAGIGGREDIPAAVPTNDNIKRYFLRLRDHAASFSSDFAREFGSERKTTFKSGVYGEYRRRSYAPREFIYRYDNLSYDERRALLVQPFGEILDAKNLAADKIYLDEITRKTHAYAATVMHAAAYALAEFAVGKLSVYGGLRLENHHVRLERDRTDAPDITLPSSSVTNELSWLPSVNLNYKFSDRHRLRASYGRSVNRPELREISPAVYYDFDLFNEIVGKEDLKTATIDNVDLRYEFYPDAGDALSFGVFYKRFQNPVEWTFIDMGGSLRYCNENARRADNTGIEADLRKDLGFIGLKDLTLVANATAVLSRVQFAPGEVVSEPDRMMQGQSPYAVNAGLYYRNEKLALGATLLYNRTGERIAGTGKSYSADGNTNAAVPDTWEMPRNSLDLTLTKRIGAAEIRLSVKDMLAEDTVFKQFPKFVKNGAEHKRQQTTKRYNQGQSVSLGVVVRL